MNTYVIALIPVYILFIFFIAMTMFRRRVRAVKAGQIKLSHFKSYTGEVPEDLRIIQSHFNNQFQVPVLFLITCLSAVVLQVATPLTFILGICFILSRVVHTVVHLGGNNLKLRAISYAVGILLILGMWIQIVLT